MDNTFYTCPYCKEEYTNPTDLAHCILSCEDKKKREEEERKQAELALVKKTRMKEIEVAADHYHKLVKEFIKDYGSIEISSNYDDWYPMIKNNFFPWWF